MRVDTIVKSVLFIFTVLLIGCSNQGVPKQGGASFLNEVSVTTQNASGPYYYDQEYVNDFTIPLN